MPDIPGAVKANRFSLGRPSISLGFSFAARPTSRKWISRYKEVLDEVGVRKIRWIPCLTDMAAFQAMDRVAIHEASAK
jgi:hypothetical protein